MQHPYPRLSAVPIAAGLIVSLALLPVAKLDESVALFKAADPSLKVYVLDFEQEIEIPGD